MKRDLSICMLLCVAGCRFESSGLNQEPEYRTDTGGISSALAESGGKASGGTSSSPRGGTSFVSSTAFGGTSSTTASGGTPESNPSSGETLASSGGVSTTSEQIQTGGTSSTEETTVEEPTCEPIEIITARTRIGPRSSYESSFSIDCPFSQASLEVLFDGARGPNYETPPIISISNDLHTQSFNAATFMPERSDDACWTNKPDGSHDFSCAFLATADLTGILTAGDNSIYIVGKQGDTFTVSSIRILF